MRALFIPDNYDRLDLDYLKRQAGPKCHVEFLGEQAEGDSYHGDYMAQCAIRAANLQGGLTHLFLCDRTTVDWLDVRKTLVKTFPRMNTSCSFGGRPIDYKDDSLVKMLKQEWKKNTVNETKSELFDGEGSFFFACGNWGDEHPDSDLAWPQAYWADRFSNVFLIAACDRTGRPATFSSQSNDLPNEGVISIATAGVDVPVRNPDSGMVKGVSGTSPAAAIASGDATGRGLFTPGPIKDSWEERLTINKAFYDEWLAGEHHKSMGRGAILDKRFWVE